MHFDYFRCRFRRAYFTPLAIAISYAIFSASRRAAAAIAELRQLIARHMSLITHAPRLPAPPPRH